MVYAITKHFTNGILKNMDVKEITAIKYELNKDYGEYTITFIKPIDNNDIIAVIGSKYGIEKAFSNGNYDFAKMTAKHYRNIGYDVKMYLMEN